MNFDDIIELREAIGNYIYTFGCERRRCAFDEDKSNAITRLHDAIDKIELESIIDVLSKEDIYETSIISDTKLIYKKVGELRQFVLDNVPYCKRCGTNAREVLNFCKKFESTLASVENYFYERIEKERLTFDIPIGEYEVSEIVREFRYSMVDFMRYFNYISHNSTIQIHKNRKEVTMRLSKVAKWCNEHYIETSKMLSICPPDEIDELRIIATEFIDDFEKWSEVIGYDADAIRIFSDIGMILDNCILKILNRIKEE